MFQILLLLLLCEVMASKHVPLNQTPEYDAHRSNTMAAASSVFNLMTLGSVIINQTTEYDYHRSNTMAAANFVFNLMTLVRYR